MRPETLAELADRSGEGVVQPIIVRPIDAPMSAAYSATRSSPGTPLARRAAGGLRDIPAVIRRVPDEAAIAMA